MDIAPHTKVTASHLERDAYLYVRQSTVRQVMENTESTHRQYALPQRAVALGWPMDRIHVIDCDQGQSGASAADREGFQRLVTEVSLGRVGIVLGLEVSRLARNCADWHRLVQICSLSHTLILDEDGLYDPNDFNDRLLLGLKGTMSEAELHLIQSRLRGGILSKASRGELPCVLPTGFVYDDQNQVRLDPDQQVRETLQLFFETFRRIGTATGTAKFFRQNQIPIPRRPRTGPSKGKVVWEQLTTSRALCILHHPRYAGAFCFGRRRVGIDPQGRRTCKYIPRQDWHALIPDAHDGYISWAQFERNQRQLLDNLGGLDLESRRRPPREGPALLQGLLICGICGQRMYVRYRMRCGERSASYTCTYNRNRGIQNSDCQNIHGPPIEKAVADLILKKLTPLTIDVALAVQAELSAKIDQADALRHQQVERAQYEADSARNRYMQADPNNRLVASVLEADWNSKLNDLKRAHQDYERQSQSDRLLVDEALRQRLMSLCSDFPRLWNDPNTPHQDRKRMIRLLVEDVTVTKADHILVNVRFKGGSTASLKLPRPLRCWEIGQTPPELVAEVDRLLDHHTEKQIALLFNQRGQLSPKGLPFKPAHVMGIRRNYGLRSRFDRLRPKGLLTVSEIAAHLDIHPKTVRIWLSHGILRGHKVNERPLILVEPPGPDIPAKAHAFELSERCPDCSIPSHPAQEV